MTPPPTTRHLIVGVARNLFLAGCAAYGLNVTLFVIARALIGERWGIIALFNNFAHLLWAPALIILPICLLWRKWLLTALSIAPAVALISAYLPMLAPKSVPPPMPNRFYLLTYNLLAQKTELDQLADFMLSTSADIIAVQELSFPAAEALAAALADSHPYQALHPGAVFEGQGIFSRYPILADDYWVIYLGHQQVTLDINGMTVTLFNAHPIHALVPNLGFSAAPRRQEIMTILSRATALQGPIILAGDFNITDLSEDYARIRSASFRDVYRDVGMGLGFTFPNALRGLPFLGRSPIFQWLPPLARIDYVFINAGLVPLSAEVLPYKGYSDHYPLKVELGLPSS